MAHWRKLWLFAETSSRADLCRRTLAASLKRWESLMMWGDWRAHENEFEGFGTGLMSRAGGGADKIYVAFRSLNKGST